MQKEPKSANHACLSRAHSNQCPNYFLTTESCKPYDSTIFHICLGRPTREIGWLDSEPISYVLVPRNVPASVPHSKTPPNAVYLQFLTTVWSQLQIWNLEPEYSSREEHCAIPTTHLYLKVVPRWNGIISEIKHQVSKGDLCIWCHGHWTPHHWRDKHGQSI